MGTKPRTLNSQELQHPLALAFRCRQRFPHTHYSIRITQNLHRRLWLGWIKEATTSLALQVDG